jgi:hypothetical protein
MGININCRQNDQGAWCRDRRVKRSLLGLGARVCSVFEGKPCEFQDMFRQPRVAPRGQNNALSLGDAGKEG